MKKTILFVFLIMNHFCWSQETKTDLEKEVEKVDFNELKDILIKDKIYENAQRKKKISDKIKEERKKTENQKSEFPHKTDFWEIASEHWLVKNAPMLKWDFKKPIYGIGIELKKTLLKLGYVEKKIKIIYTKSSVVPHFSLPTGKEQYLLVLSIPFIKTMDLSKKEISMLLLEDMVRSDEKLFEKNLKETSFLKKLGSKVEQGKVKASAFEYKKLLGDYSDLIMKRGYTFQQQFEITRLMDKLLKPNPEYWNAYYQLCVKRDLLTKSNQSYKQYSGLYPSPVMQLNWLKPKEEKIFK